MNTGTWTALIGLLITVIANIVTIVVFLTRQADSLKSLKDSFKEFKEDIKRKIEKNQDHTEQHIRRLEEKQDKHNCLIERMAIVEQSTKSAHHRLDELKGTNNEYISKRN